MDLIVGGFYLDKLRIEIIWMVFRVIELYWNGVV